MAVTFPCLYCDKPVYPTGSNAVMHPVSKEWQHRDCCPDAVESNRALAEVDGDRDP